MIIIKKQDNSLLNDLLSKEFDLPLDLNIGLDRDFNSEDDYDEALLEVINSLIIMKAIKGKFDKRTEEQIEKALETIQKINNRKILLDTKRMLIEFYVVKIIQELLNKKENITMEEVIKLYENIKRLVKVL